MEIKKKTTAKAGAASASFNWARVREILSIIWFWLFHLRKLVLSVPVVWGTIYFAKMNLERLPEEVGLTLMSNGQFAQSVSRTAAVYGPVGVTAVCLILMWCSRRAIYPWLISLFTLVLPPVILLINTFPS